MKKKHPGIKFTAPNQVDLIGKRFGKLEVIEKADPTSTGGKVKSRWLCKCDCGQEKIIRADTLSAGTTTSCGCKLKEARKDPEEMGLRSVRQMYIDNCRKRKMPFELNDEEFKELVLSDCHYCGKKPAQVRKHSNTHARILYNGIDRKDNSIHYIKSNCVPCCKDCNWLKTDRSYEDFLNKIKQIYERVIKDVEK